MANKDIHIDRLFIIIKQYSVISLSMSEMQNPKTISYPRENSMRGRNRNWGLHVKNDDSVYYVLWKTGRIKTRLASAGISVDLHLATTGH